MKENPESGYWKIGPIYVKKVFLLTVLAAGAIAAIGYFGLPTELLEKPPGETVYRFDDPALKDLSEPVRICDENNVIRYEGPVEKGVCTGSGRVYDETGALISSGLRNASALGLLAEGCTVLAKARDVDPMPAPGEQVEFDGALWLVGDDVSETGGLAHIPLERAL